MSPDEYRHLLHPPFPVLDFHIHPLDGIGPYPVDSPAEDAGRILESARRARVSRACVFSLHRTMPREPSMDQCRQANHTNRREKGPFQRSHSSMLAARFCM